MHSRRREELREACRRRTCARHRCGRRAARAGTSATRCRGHETGGANVRGAEPTATFARNGSLACLAGRTSSERLTTTRDRRGCRWARCRASRDSTATHPAAAGATRFSVRAGPSAHAARAAARDRRRGRRATVDQRIHGVGIRLDAIGECSLLTGIQALRARVLRDQGGARLVVLRPTRDGLPRPRLARLLVEGGTLRRRLLRLDMAGRDAGVELRDILGDRGLAASRLPVRRRATAVVVSDRRVPIRGDAYGNDREVEEHGGGLQPASHLLASISQSQCAVNGEIPTSPWTGRRSPRGTLPAPRAKAKTGVIRSCGSDHAR